MILFSISWLIHVLVVLLTVAFFTLFERKVMGLVHLRVGPNKPTFTGVLQPLLDAFKLLTKQNLVSYSVNKFTYASGPHLSLVVSLMFWVLLPSFSYVVSNSYSFIGFVFVGSIMVYSSLLAGWSSNSKYSFIGSLRSIAQSVSYEAVMTTLLIVMLIYSMSFSIKNISMLSSFFVLIMILPLWFFCSIAETHRAPFDFSESESELVSGYNTEYAGAYFAYVFLGEYSSLLFSSALMYYVFLSFFFGSLYMFPLFFSLGTLFISFIFIMIRVTYCRSRYDHLMSMAWKSFLPISLCILIMFFFVISKAI